MASHSPEILSLLLSGPLTKNSNTFLIHVHTEAIILLRWEVILSRRFSNVSYFTTNSYKTVERQYGPILVFFVHIDEQSSMLTLLN